MEIPGIGANSDGESIVETFRPFNEYAGPLSDRVCITRNVFGAGSSFRQNDDSNGSSDDVIRADLSLNDGIGSPRDIRLLCTAREDDLHPQIRDPESDIESGAFLRNFSVQTFAPDCEDFESDRSVCDPDVSLACDSPLRLGAPADDRADRVCSGSRHPVEPFQKSVLRGDISRGGPTSSSFITMDNSNNAIDNSLRESTSVSAALRLGSDGHIFKPPSGELNFNGTLRRFQKPHSDAEARLGKDVSKAALARIPETEAVEEESAEDYPCRSSDETSWNSNASASDGSKSGGAPSSPAWRFRFPIEMNRTSVERLPPEFVADSDPSPDREIVACGKILTFAGTVSPFGRVADGTTLEVADKAEATPSKVFENNDLLQGCYDGGAQSPNMFSDEEECPDLKKALTFKQFEKWDKMLLKKLEKTLQGVLPPPSVTISQLTALQLLKLYNENLSKYTGEDKKAEYWNDAEASSSVTPPRRISCDFVADLYASRAFATALENSCSAAAKSSRPTDRFEKTSPGDSDEAPRARLLNMNGSEASAMDSDWPDLLQCRYHGVHYNLSLHSEEIDMLTCKYAARYIGCETASSCVSTSSLSTGVSALRRSRAADMRSPGRRLSHLARRRTAFCNAASLQPPSLHQRRQILVDRRRLAEAVRRPGAISPRKRTPGKRTPGKKTPGKKTPGKKTPGKKTPVSTRGRRPPSRVPQRGEESQQPTRETSKRALFLSPENSTQSVQPVASASVSSCRGLRSKRALFASPPSDDRVSLSGVTTEAPPGKRPRCDQGDVKRSFLPKSLSFSGEKTVDPDRRGVGVQAIARRASEYSLRNRDLSDQQKKKLLWSVAEALRGQGVGVSDESFRRYAVPLARLTRKICSLPQHQHALAAHTSSTSDTLLKIARLHVFSVMRGKSVDELFLEEQTKQLTAPAAGGARLSGYVPPAHSFTHSAAVKNVNSENSFPDKRTFRTEQTGGGVPKSVLQDKTVNIDVRSNSCSDLSAGSEMKKAADRDRLRARRQISFDFNTFTDAPADR